MPKRIAVLVALTVAFTGFVWRPANGDDVGKRDKISSDHLVDGSWVLRIDRTWSKHTNVDSPLAQLPEADYRPLANGPTYPIVVSEGASRVEVGGNARLAAHPLLKGPCSFSGEQIVCNLQGKRPASPGSRSAWGQILGGQIPRASSSAAR